MIKGLKNILSEDNGNLSTLRCVLFFSVFIVLPAFIALCFYNEKIHALFAQLLMFISGLSAAKVVQKPLEEDVVTPIGPPDEPVVAAPAPEPVSYEPKPLPDIGLSITSRRWYRPEYVYKYGAAFAQGVAFVLDHEVALGRHGEVVTEKDVNDPGGATKYGIDQRAHPHVKVAALTLDDAVQIYHDGEWTKAGCDELPTETAVATFDTAVNCGTEHALRWLHEAQTFLGDIIDDSATAATLLNRRVTYYKEEVRPSLRAHYLKGWLARVEDLRKALAL